MKVGLIVDPYGEKMPGGLGRAIWELAKAIVSVGNHTYTVYLKESPRERPSLPVEVAVADLRTKKLWFSPGPKFDRTLDAYVFFTPVMPLTFFPKRAVVVAHDFAYLELPGRSFKERLEGFALYWLHWLSLKKATTIVAVSHATKESVMQHFGIPEERIEVVYNGFIPFMCAPEIIETPEKFFLFAGVLKERKNVKGVIRAFAHIAAAQPEYALLVAGKKGGRYYESLEALVKELGIEGRVRFLGYVTDGQLAYLYKKAEALVFPSFVEGFGMPVLEAMHLGLPVVTSSEGALAEVAGDAAVLANPHDPEEIAAAMQKLLADKGLRDSLVECGKTRATEFSWDKAGAQFRTILDKSLGI